jgi:hypothetical protein
VLTVRRSWALTAAPAAALLAALAWPAGPDVEQILPSELPAEQQQRRAPDASRGDLTLRVPTRPGPTPPAPEGGVTEPALPPATVQAEPSPSPSAVPDASPSPASTTLADCVQELLDGAVAGCRSR